MKIITANEIDELVSHAIALAKGARIDVLKLRVSIHMLVAFAGFAVRLQAIARLLQKLAHHGVADLMSLVRKLFAQLTQTARSP